MDVTNFKYVHYLYEKGSIGRSFGQKPSEKKFRTNVDISDEKLSECLFKGGKTFAL